MLQITSFIRIYSFAPPEITDVEFNTAWLYDEADRQWARWLPADVSSSVRYGGYYTALAQPGLRIVSMNMNYCYIFNYWTYYKSQDPASILTWLNQVLEDAELAGEKVKYIAHSKAQKRNVFFLKFLLIRYISSATFLQEILIAGQSLAGNLPKLLTDLSPRWRPSFTVTLTTTNTRSSTIFKS